MVIASGNILSLDNHLVLTGMPGSGKSSVARLMAFQLGCQAVDTDELIAQQAQLTIPQIFTQEGENGFRDHETRALREALQPGPGRIVALGGGTVLREENRELLQGSLVIYLETSVETLLNRVGAGVGRPLLSDGEQTPRERLQELLDKRRPLYESVSTYSVNTDGLEAPAVAARVLEVLGSEVEKA